MALKPIGDVNDFEIIDVWGMPDGGYWVIGGVAIAVNGAQDLYIRKPHVQKGNPIPGGAFGVDNPEECEWTRIVPSDVYGDLPNTVEVALGGIGSHFMDPITVYMSTVNSGIYHVSQGYGHDEEIMGIITGTTVSEFLTGIIKKDEGQTLTLMAGADTATVLDDNTVLSMNDVLVVLSSDKVNTTYYRIDVTNEGFSKDAVLTSSVWDIQITVTPDADQDIVGEATISGFAYGTTLKTIMDDINVPSGALVNYINSSGEYVALKKLNYDTVYVEATVSPEISIEVLAEDGRTRIIYDLLPESTESDAFILSDVYLVTQEIKLIEYVPLGVTFSEFLQNIIIPNGATLKLIDKKGLERTTGEIKADDKVVVTSANEEVTNIYLISLLFPGTESSTFLAFVTSDVFSVDQSNYTISGTVESPITNATSVLQFMQHIIPSPGATAVVVDADGNEKTSGAMAEGDHLKVTSGDNVLISYYEIILGGNSIRMSDLTNLEIYPNPTSEQLNIYGLNPGNRIRIYTIQGKMMKDIETQNNHQSISLENVPDGLFLIIISDEEQVIGQFKAVKQ